MNQVMSARSDNIIRCVAIVCIASVALSSAILSWNGLSYLGVQSGIPEEIAFLIAVSIDGMILLGGVEVIHATLTGRATWYGWGLSFLGVVISIWGNIASVSEADVQSKLTHSIPPMILFLSVEAMLRIMRNRIVTSKELEAELERTALREARKQKQEQSKITTASTDRAAGKPTGKLATDDPEVEQYRELVSTLPETASKASKVEKILATFPEARTGHIALCLDVQPRAIATTVQRAKTKLQGAEPTDIAFNELVKQF